MLPIKITDSASIGRGKTHRVVGRKYDRNAYRGFYCQEWHGKPAWIQLVADNIVAGYPTFLLRFQLLRDLVVAEVLYNASGLDGRQGSCRSRHEPYYAVSEIVPSRWSLESWLRDSAEGWCM